MRHVLAVALHRELLQVRGEASQVLVVGQHRSGLRAEEIAVPDRQDAEQHREVALEDPAVSIQGGDPLLYAGTAGVLETYHGRPA